MSKSKAEKRLSKIILYFIFSFLCLIEVISANQSKYKVLILNSYHHNFTWTRKQTEGIMDRLKVSKLANNISVEYMDWKNYPTTQNLKSLYNYYKYKYSGNNIDIIITTDDIALEFALQNREEIFSNAPIVFSGVNIQGVDYLTKNEKNITGVVEPINLESTVDMALRINPDMETFYIIYDQTESGKTTGELTTKAIKRLNRDINVVELTNQTHQEILDQLAELPKNSSVLITTYYSDAEENTIEFEEFCSLASEKSSVPLFHMYDITLGYGNIGGSMISARTHGQQAADLAIRILEGEKADNIALIDKNEMRVAFDYEQLEKFDIPLNRIPKGTEVINEPFSFYKTYKKLVLVTMLILVMLIVFISILLVYIREIKIIKNQLQQSNEEITQTYEELVASDEELIRQVHELNKARKQLKKLAYYDALTELPNRRALQDNISLYTKEKHYKKAALMFIDVDNFKFINDTLGHNVGDQCIIQIGKRLKSIVKKPSKLYRISGDEFVVFMPYIKEQSEFNNIAEDILNQFKNSFEIKGMVLHISVSIGIAVYPYHGLTGEELLMNADIAMYKAKEEGRAKYTLYDPIMNQHLLERVEIENNLRKGIVNQEFELYYQPQYNFEESKITGFEALIRWNNKKMGQVSPLKFIKVAEESQIIITLGEWIIDNACKFIKKLHNIGHKDKSIAVNISLLQIVQENFVTMILDTLKKHNLDPCFLELEITETMLIENFEVVSEKLETLRKSGIKIALDDFGTGYSSLSYLNRLPINILKIDKSFVDTIIGDDNNKVIINILINLGHKMGLKVIAEGVETKEAFNYLKQYKCDMMQGYLVSKPLNESDAIKILSKIQN